MYGWGVPVQGERGSPSGGLCLEVSLQGCLCLGGISVWGEVSAQGLCTEGSLSRRVLCPGGGKWSLCKRSLCPKESLSGGSLLKEVSVQGGLCGRDLNPPPVDRRRPVKTLPSATSFAGGNWVIADLTSI